MARAPAYGDERWHYVSAHSDYQSVSPTGVSQPPGTVWAEPSADDGPSHRVVNEPDASGSLMSSPARTPHHPTLPHPLPHLHPASAAANSSVTTPSINSSSHVRQGVPSLSHPASTNPRYGVNQHALGSLPLSSHLTSSRHETISSRPRTTAISPDLNSLAHHHGLPQFLPPAPQHAAPEPAHIDQQIPVAEEPFPPDFADLCSNYLNMLTQNPLPDVTDMPAAPQVEADAVQALMDALQGEPPAWTFAGLALTVGPASPDFPFVEPTDSPQFLTSPMESPWDDFLATPMMIGGDADFSPDILTSPALYDDSGVGAFAGLPLFGDMTLDFEEPVPVVEKPLAAAPTGRFDGLYTLSPASPALDTSPLAVDAHTFAVPTAPVRPTAGSAKRRAPTGTRKNVTPDTLIPIDAPIQTRKYSTPSATSRKDVPATFARKRARSQAFGDDDEDVDAAAAAAAAGPPTEGEAAAIEAKRLQNTLAARRSRKRKLEHLKGLEDRADGWQAHALELRAMLERAGVAPPPMPVFAVEED
jgi:hypothetical protein